MKKVLIYSHYFWPSVGGVERFTEQLAEGLTRKYKVYIMTKTESSKEEQDVCFPFTVLRINELSYKEKPDVDLIVISGYSVKMILYAWLWNIPSIVIHHGDLINCSNGTGLHHGELCHHRKINCFKYDIQYEGSLVAIKKLINLMIKKSISILPKHHIFVSQWLKNATGLNGKVIYNCFDELFAVDGTIEKKKQIMFAGRLVDIKGCDSLLRAYAKAGLSMPLYICGDGAEKEKLQILSQNLGIAGKVLFKGSLTKEEIVKVMQDSMICVVPSIIEESFGIVAIEAAAAKCIVLGRKLGGLSEVCEKVGYSFSTDTELVELLKQAEKNTLIEKSKNVDYFSCEKMMKEYINIIEENI